MSQNPPLEQLTEIAELWKQILLPRICFYNPQARCCLVPKFWEYSPRDAFKTAADSVPIKQAHKRFQGHCEVAGIDPESGNTLKAGDDLLAKLMRSIDEVTSPFCGKWLARQTGQVLAVMHYYFSDSGHREVLLPLPDFNDEFPDYTSQVTLEFNKELGILKETPGLYRPKKYSLPGFHTAFKAMSIGTAGSASQKVPTSGVQASGGILSSTSTAPILQAGPSISSSSFMGPMSTAQEVMPPPTSIYARVATGSGLREEASVPTSSAPNA
jgi:hypothetical protein